MNNNLTKGLVWGGWTVTVLDPLRVRMLDEPIDWYWCRWHCCTLRVTPIINHIKTNLLNKNLCKEGSYFFNSAPFLRESQTNFKLRLLTGIVCFISALLTTIYNKKQYRKCSLEKYSKLS